MADDEMIEWHHRHDRHEFEQTSGVGYGQEARSAVVHWVAKSHILLSE